MLGDSTEFERSSCDVNSFEPSSLDVISRVNASVSKETGPVIENACGLNAVGVIGTLGKCAGAGR